MYLQAKIFSTHGILHGFCGRAGGVSLPPYASLNFSASHGDQPETVENNSQLLVENLRAQRPALTLGSLITLKQESSDQIVDLQVGDATRVGDALISANPLQILGIKTADCMPVLLVDRRRGWSAAIHMGWRGALLNIVGKTGRRLLQQGSQSADWVAALGPSIGPCCLRLAGGAAAEFEAWSQTNRSVESKVGPVFRREAPGVLWVDLYKVAQGQLLELGISIKNLENLNSCTVCDQRFFSYRRDGIRTGRQLGFVLPPAL